MRTEDKNWSTKKPDDQQEELSPVPVLDLGNIPRAVRDSSS